MWYDTAKLFSESDLRDVVRQYWDSRDYNDGTTMYIRCPSGHHETQLNHCAVYKTGCKCFSCGKYYPTCDAVSAYYKEKGQALTFEQICEKIADASGGRERFTQSHDRQKSSAPHFDREGLSAVGLNLYDLDHLPNREIYRKVTEKAREYIRVYTELEEEETNPLLKAEWAKRKRLVRSMITEYSQPARQKNEYFRRKPVPKMFRL